MEYTPLEQGQQLRRAFAQCFTQSWEEFQEDHREFLARYTGTRHPLDKAWYDRAYLWEKLPRRTPSVSFSGALSRLAQREGNVVFMGQDTPTKEACMGRADARALAARIEEEWYGNYRLWEQGMYSTEYFLPEDLYVFDESLTWFMVFTHETTDWESELTDPMKAAESRVCFCFP